MIEKEVKKNNVAKALRFMVDQIEDTYPEITKAIQQRRAEYYLLSHQYSFIQTMLKKGQIEEKQCQRITSEIDEKIFQLQTRNPEIHWRNQKDLIKIESEFEKIFSEE